jgi:hypothetical protein
VPVLRHPGVRIGDVPRVGKGYVATAPNPQVTADQVAAFPRDTAQAVGALVDDYEAQESVEARLARDADKLECLIHAQVPGTRARRSAVDRDRGRGASVGRRQAPRGRLLAHSARSMVEGVREGVAVTAKPTAGAVTSWAAVT